MQAEEKANIDAKVDPEPALTDTFTEPLNVNVGSEQFQSIAVESSQQLADEVLRGA